MAETFDERAPFDVVVLEREYADAPDILTEIFTIFAEETPERLEMLRSGMKEGDLARVKKAAHSLANTSGTLRADRALMLARATEAAAREEDLPRATAHAERLVEEASQILEQIRSRL